MMYDGPTALAAIQAKPPDVVVLDIGLPGMDGYEVARQLRASPAFRRVPLVAVTGYGQENDRARSMQAGFDEHFTKPVDPEALQQSIALFATPNEKNLRIAFAAAVAHENLKRGRSSVWLEFAMRIRVGQISARCESCGCGDFQPVQPGTSPAHELLCFSCGASTSRGLLLMQIADETTRRAERFIARSKKARGQLPKR